MAIPPAIPAFKDWNWRYELLRPAFAHPARSAERAKEVRIVARLCRVSERSVYHWMRAYEAQGIAGLERAGRSDKGRRRVLVGQGWDRAVPLDEAVKRDIRTKLLRKVRSLWADAAPGWRHIQRTATIHLAKLTRAAGLDLPEQELLALCGVPRAFIMRERRKYRELAKKDKDAKAFSDNLPRIRREYSELDPLGLVIGDVHPVDIYFLRPDGTVQPVRLIAWLDSNTNRLVGHVLFPEKDTGVRMEHAAASFAHMVLAWGVPGALYIDNGGEYNWSEFAADAMKLVKSHGDDRRAVIKALPYNAQAKKIEGIFAVLERQFFSTLPGWIGGNRMAAKTHNVGKAPKPFPGTPEDLNAAIQQQIAAYNATPQDILGGLSPDRAWGKAVEGGWSHVAADMATLQAAFAREETRTVRQAEIRIGNRFYTHDELCARPYLEKVTVRIPIFGDARPAVYEPDGSFICHAEEQTAYGALDVAGARESARRKRLAHKGAEALRADVDPVDSQVETAAFLALNPPPARPEPAGRIGLAPEMARDAEGRRKLGPQEKLDKAAKDEASRQSWRDTMDSWVA